MKTKFKTFLSLAFLTFILNYSCEKSINPVSFTSYGYNEIVGNISKVTEGGISPAQNISVILYFINDSLEVKTSEDGDFFFIISDSINSGRFKVNLDKFTNIDTIVNINKSTEYHFFLNQLVPYLSLKSNNWWKYLAEFREQKTYS